MKKVFAMLCAALLSLSAFAGSPIVVKDANGAKPTGTDQVIRVEKNTDSGYRVKRLLRGGVTDYAADNANWTIYDKYVSGMLIPVVSGNITFDAAKIRTDCSYPNTTVVAATVGPTEYINDNCALDVAVRALAQ